MAGKITLIEVQKKNPRRVNVHLDGTYRFPLSLEVATQAGLKRDMELDEAHIARLIALDTQQKLYDAALNYLSFRPRSEAEVRRYLAGRKAPADIVERIIARLSASTLLDDAAFARFWVENRETFSPRSKRALQSELRSKGLSDAVIAEEVAGDDSASAYHAAQKRLRSWAALDYDTFRQKALSFLMRRGFAYATAQETVKRLWQERTSAPADDDAPA